MLREDVVRELLVRLEREGVKPVARQLGVDRKTVKRWREAGQWRQVRPRGVSLSSAYLMGKLT
jgi:hypothetical protein